jgi:hypothetical protein
MKSCGACNLCCKLAAIEELQKPAGQWCKYAKPGIGCTIHGHHPEECQSFRCGWLKNDGLDDDWKPTTCKFVIRIEDELGRIIIANDTAHPDAWKKPRYYQVIKGWARDWGVVSYAGNRATMVYPDQDLEVGEINPGDAVHRGYRGGPLVRAPWVRVEPVGGGPHREYLGRYGKS